MKILVFSDSHGSLHAMKKAVAQEAPDHILHLGDVVKDAKAIAGEFPHIPLDLVPGNCDYAPDEQEKKLLVLAGIRILMTHGHIYGVKAGIGRAVLAAREMGANVLLFGHTHEALCDYDDRLWILNPGSCRGPLFATYGVITVEEGICNCRTMRI